MEVITEVIVKVHVEVIVKVHVEVKLKVHVVVIVKVVHVVIICVEVMVTTAKGKYNNKAFDIRCCERLVNVYCRIVLIKVIGA